MVTTRTPKRTGTRSREAPSSVASASPTVATRERDTIDAMTVPTIAQTASVSSAPKRRNHRNPYTVETTFPAGSELVRACEASVILKSGEIGGVNPPPALRSWYSMAVKLMNESTSAPTAARIHHQFTWSNTAVMPDSSSVCELRTQTAMATAPMPTRYLRTGQARRSCEFPPGVPCPSESVAPGRGDAPAGPSCEASESCGLIALLQETHGIESFGTGPSYGRSGADPRHRPRADRPA